jgi:hypothetical protein
MLAGAPTKAEAKSAEANAIVPIGLGICPDIFSPCVDAATIFMQNSITKRSKLGNPGLVSAHFAGLLCLPGSCKQMKLFACS